jgi:thiol-disulfide isomerase/thioredoxin
MKTIVSLMLFSSLLGQIVGNAHADDLQTSSPRQQYQAILDEFAAAKLAFKAKFDAAGTEELRQALRQQVPISQDYYGRFLSLAEAYPGDVVAVDSLVWIVATSAINYDDFKDRGINTQKAMDILARDHINKIMTGRACLNLDTSPAPLRDRFLQTIYMNSTDRQVKGRACLALGGFLLKKSEVASLLKGPSGEESMKKVKAEAVHRLPYYEKLLRDDPKKLSSDGEALLEKVIAEYSDIPYDPVLIAEAGDTLATIAKNNLRRFHHITVGQQAPEIDGKDVHESRFKLSDYRGRVVLLTFSGNWCGPCRALYPQERDLDQQLKGRPFVMLSVNTDQDRETLQKSISQGEITWRCWWESGTNGPICSQWMIEGFPQVFLLDHKGVIRSQDRLEHLDRKIEELLQACESDTQRAK